MTKKPQNVPIAIESYQDHKPSHSHILSCYVTIALLTVLLDKSSLSQAVKAHCNTGLKVIEILHTDRHYNTGIEGLYDQAFDAFFKLFAPIYFKNRGIISVDLIMTCIERSIKQNMVYGAGV